MLLIICFLEDFQVIQFVICYVRMGESFTQQFGLLVFSNYLLFRLRYAAPEQYIMSTQTPSAPSAPVATALSPVLWQV